MSSKLVLESSKIHIRARPAELYLTSDNVGGQLNIQVFYDLNVFEEGVVREWLDEVRGAVLWYLGQTHRSRQIQQRRSDGDGCGEGVQAKL